VVVCKDDGPGGSVRFSEMSPAQFEIQRAQCAQKKWRQSFKVIGEPPDTWCDFAHPVLLLSLH
jgi:hypothetical protein